MSDAVTFGAHGSTAAPAAGAALATLSGLAPGEYEIHCGAYLTGTVAAVDGDNVVLQVDGTTVATLLVPPVANLAPAVFRFVVNTAGTVRLAAVAAGTSTATYRTFLSAGLIPASEYR